MRFCRRLTALALAAAVVAGAAAGLPGASFLAPRAALAAQEERAALTDRTMEAFVASIPAMRAWTEQHDDAARAVAPKVLKPSVLSGNPFALVVEELRGSDAYTAMGATVGRHGFDTPEAWAGVANRVTKALGVLASRTDQADNALAEAQREIETNPRITAEDRMKLKGLLMALSLFANAPEADVAVVAPYSGRIVEALR
ncbi:hypothetical protein [Caenispirillum salinarum]|uniref:hypothetical protein n=1 Tax=Caenispirillum salinarum TaxID=859058 RepID=UPI00384B074B